MPLAVWNVYSGISFYQTKSSATRSLESLLSVNFRCLTFINIASTCVIYTVTARLFREELWALFQYPWLKNALRNRIHPQPFLISSRIAPNS